MARQGPPPSLISACSLQQKAALTHSLPQANAVSDKLLDLRECKLQGSDLSGKTLSGALLLGADLSNSNLREAVFSKACPRAMQPACCSCKCACLGLLTWDCFRVQAYAVNTNFSGMAYLAVDTRPLCVAVD